MFTNFLSFTVNQLLYPQLRVNFSPLTPPSTHNIGENFKTSNTSWWIKDEFANFFFLFCFYFEQNRKEKKAKTARNHFKRQNKSSSLKRLCLWQLCSYEKLHNNSLHGGAYCRIRSCCGKYALERSSMNVDGGEWTREQWAYLNSIVGDERCG